jgi:hypothetical protein
MWMDACQSFFLMPRHPDLRAKTIFFLHRLVDTLHAGALVPQIGECLVALLDCQADNIIPVMELVNQIIQKGKADALPLLESLFLPIVQRQFACFDEFAHVPPPASAAGDSGKAAASEPEAAFSGDRRTFHSLQKVCARMGLRM